MGNLQFRSRFVYLLLVIVVMMLGLASRATSIQPHLLNFIREYAGDTLYALLLFFVFAFLWRHAATAKIAVLALTFCVAIELSQLYQAPWIEAVRRTRIGGLVLGFGFLWSDLLCYVVGILLGILFEVTLLFLKKRNSA